LLRRSKALRSKVFYYFLVTVRFVVNPALAGVYRKFPSTGTVRLKMAGLACEAACETCISVRCRIVQCRFEKAFSKA
jgi:hypothetical protein